LALTIHAILYPGISKVFAVTVKISQQQCRASEMHVDISVIPACMESTILWAGGDAGPDFVNLPSLLILSVSQLPDRERCLRESRRLPPSKRE
jgi:hypothetical protein